MVFYDMSWLERVILLKRMKGGGGIPLTYSGNLPATITAVAHAIQSLTRYGLCTQDGTPTPDAPVDIMTNNGVLKVSPNLLDPSPSNIVIGESISVQGESATAANNWRTDYIPVVGGKTYIFYGRRKSDNVISAYNRMNFYTADKTFISPRPSYEQNTPIVATAPSNAAYVRLSSATYNSLNPITRDTFDAFNWIFAAASSEIPYMPYGVVYAGGTHPGQNLVDLTAVTDDYYYDPNGVYTAVANARLTDYIPVKSGQTYTVYVKAQQSGTAANVRCNLFDSAKIWKSQSSFTVASGAEGVNTITPPENGYLRVSANYTGTGAKVDWSTLQIVRGEYTLATMPPYEPYIEIPYTPEVLTITGKNLFNQARFSEDVGTTVTYNTFKAPNGTYTFSTNFPGVKQSNLWYTNVFILAGEQQSGASTADNGVYNGVPRTITVTDGKFTVAYRSTGTINTNNPKDYNWMLAAGSSVAEYEPYVTPQTVGWKNLFDASSYVEINAYVNANTGVLTAGSSGSNTQYCAVIPCKPNTQYNITGQGASAWGAFTSDSIGTTATTFTKGGNLTTGANDRYLIGLVRANGDSIDYRNTLVVRETVTDIPMLLGVGDYKDEAEFINGIKTGKVGIYVFTGEEAFTKGSAFYTTNTNFLPSKAGSITPICTHFHGISSSATRVADSLTMTVNGPTSGQFRGCVYFYADRSLYETAEDFKAWLASEYANGTPVIVLYPLATETTEQITPHNLVTHKGTNVVDSVANVEPVEAKIEYRGKAA